MQAAGLMALRSVKDLMMAGGGKEKPKLGGGGSSGTAGSDAGQSGESDAGEEVSAPSCCVRAKLRQASPVWGAPAIRRVQG